MLGSFASGTNCTNCDEMGGIHVVPIHGDQQGNECEWLYDTGDVTPNYQITVYLSYEGPGNYNPCDGEQYILRVWVRKQEDDDCTLGDINYDMLFYKCFSVEQDCFAIDEELTLWTEDDPEPGDPGRDCLPDGLTWCGCHADAGTSCRVVTT